MKISGKTVHDAGTAVLKPGETLELSTPLGPLTVVFKPGTNQKPPNFTSPGVLELDGYDNPFGSTAGFDNIAGWGFRAAIYAIGQGSILRVIHWTVL